MSTHFSVSRPRGADPLDGPRVTDPGDVVALVPYQLGFVPSSSLVAVALHRTGTGPTGTPIHRSIGVARVDLPRRQSDLLDAVASLHLCLHSTGADTVLVVVYGPDQRSPGTRPQRDELELEPGAVVLDLLDAVADRLHVDGVDLLDALYVEDGRWLSLLCYGTGCCDPCGRDLPAPPDVAAVAEFVARGSSPALDRAAVVATCRAGSDPLSSLVARALPAARAAQARRPVTDRTVLRRWRDALLVPARGRAADARRDDPLPTPGTLARMVAELESDDREPSRAPRSLRDAVMAWCTPDDLTLTLLPADVLAVANDVLGPWRCPAEEEAVAVVDRACALLRAVPEPDCAPVAGFVAALAWQLGDPVRARAAAEQALRRDPQHALAALVMRALDSGMRPPRPQDRS